jgi:hypothetical protein
MKRFPYSLRIFSLNVCSIDGHNLIKRHSRSRSPLGFDRRNSVPSERVKFTFKTQLYRDFQLHCSLQTISFLINEWACILSGQAKSVLPNILLGGTGEGVLILLEAVLLSFVRLPAEKQ